MGTGMGGLRRDGVGGLLLPLMMIPKHLVSLLDLPLEDGADGDEIAQAFQGVHDAIERDIGVNFKQSTTTTCSSVTTFFMMIRVRRRRSNMVVVLLRGVIMIATRNSARVVLCTRVGVKIRRRRGGGRRGESRRWCKRLLLLLMREGPTRIIGVGVKMIAAIYRCPPHIINGDSQKIAKNVEGEGGQLRRNAQNSTEAVAILIVMIVMIMSTTLMAVVVLVTKQCLLV